METIDRIRDLCKQHGTNIAQLEKTLGFGNGSLARAKTIKADRLAKIASFFNTTTDYLLTGTAEYNIPTASAVKNAFSERRQAVESNDDLPQIKTSGFFVDQESLDLLQFLSKRPEYKILFKSAASVRKDDIERAAKILDALKPDDEYAE